VGNQIRHELIAQLASCFGIEVFVTAPDDRENKQNARKVSSSHRHEGQYAIKRLINALIGRAG
jgi:hypothetical protein